MTAKTIDFNHSTGTISSDTDQTVNIQKMLKIGDGTSIDQQGIVEDGLLAIRKSPDNIPQLCKTNRNGHWEVIAEPYDESLELIYTIIMTD